MPFRHRPIALILSRQNLPTLDRTKYAPAAGLAKGAYVLADPPEGSPDVILIGTGSEVALCLEAIPKLTGENIRARVVSMPSWDLFEKQNPDYKDSVLPPRIAARVSVEQGVTLGWDRYVGPAGRSIGMTTFGASAPFQDLQKKFGFTVENIVAAAKDTLKSAGR
jgi:transketolase